MKLGTFINQYPDYCTNQKRLDAKTKRHMGRICGSYRKYWKIRRYLKFHLSSWGTYSQPGMGNTSQKQ